jgi:hypothetical protein
MKKYELTKMKYEYATDPYVHGIGCWVMQCGKCSRHLENEYRWVWDGFNATVCTTICGECCSRYEAEEELKKFCSPHYLTLYTDKIKIEEPVYKVIRSSGAIEEGWFVSCQFREVAPYTKDFVGKPTMLRGMNSGRIGILMNDSKGTRKYVEWKEFLSLNEIEYFDPPIFDSRIPEHVMKFWKNIFC